MSQQHAAYLHAHAVTHALTCLQLHSLAVFRQAASEST